jgi:hypothetical protein
MNPFMVWIAGRLLEPSTWAGVALVVNGIGTAVQTKDPTSIIQTVGGLLAVIMKEGTAKSPTPTKFAGPGSL